MSAAADRATGRRRQKSFRFKFRTRFRSKTHTPWPRLQITGYRYFSPNLGRWLSRDPIGEKGGANVYGIIHNSLISGVDLLGLLRPDEFHYRWTHEQRMEWIRGFRAKFASAVSKAATKHCVPKGALEIIIANELIDFNWPDGTMFDGSLGGGVGPAQIAVSTVYEYDVAGFSTSLSQEMYRDAVVAKLNSVAGSADVAAGLLRKYLVSLCDKALAGGLGGGLMASSLYEGCDLTVLCCDGLLYDCDKLVDYRPSKCLMGLLAAAWNSGEGVWTARDLVTDEEGKQNYKNAFRHGHWARDLTTYIDLIVDK